MTIRLLDQLIAALLTGFGLYLIWSGIGYGYMQGTTPGPGLFPAIFGAIIAVLSMVNLYRSLSGQEELASTTSRYEIVQIVAIIVAMSVFILLVPVLGMTLATMLLMFALGLILRPSVEAGKLARLATVSIALPILCLVLFDWVLKVPVPVGPLGF